MKQICKKLKLLDETANLKNGNPTINNIMNFKKAKKALNLSYEKEQEY